MLNSRSLLVLFAVACVLPDSQAPAAGRSVAVFRNGAEGYPVYRIPALIRAANGDLLAFCEARQGGDASEIDLVMKRSIDAGATWGPILKIQESDDFKGEFEGAPPDITIGNPAPVVDLLDPRFPGRIWLPFTLENQKVFVIFSDDHGATWSERRNITPAVKQPEWGWYATGPVHSIQLQYGPHRGRLVIPADHRLGARGEDKGLYGAQAFYSDDHGATWTLGAIDETGEDDLNSNETTVVELVDGTLYFNTRDNQGAAPGTRGDAFSDDGGQTFRTSGDGTYKFFVPSSAVLDPPAVQCAILRAGAERDGDPRNLILFSGPDVSGPSRGGRNDLRIRFSLDEAKTWQDGPLIHQGPAAYSDMALIGPHADRVGVLYECGDLPEKKYDRIDFQVVPLAGLK